jgi:ABC-type sugar transport system ATPase subunit
MLSLDRIGKTYPNGVHALGSVSLDVELGEIVAVIGGSGSGKSTLLRAIGGLDPASEGAIVLDGERITGPHEKIGIIFQEPRLLPWLKVADNVGFGLGDRPRSVWPTKLWPGPANYRAARRSGSPSRARWCRGRKCCCSTSRSRRSMPSRERTCRIICSICGPTPSRP